MKKRIIAALLVFLIAVCGIIALYGHTLHVSSSVSGGSLYALRDGDAAVYDGASPDEAATLARERGWPRNEIYRVKLRLSELFADDADQDEN